MIEVRSREWDALKVYRDDTRYFDKKIDAIKFRDSVIHDFCAHKDFEITEQKSGITEILSFDDSNFKAGIIITIKRA